MKFHKKIRRRKMAGTLQDTCWNWSQIWCHLLIALLVNQLSIHRPLHNTFIKFSHSLYGLCNLQRLSCFACQVVGALSAPILSHHQVRPAPAHNHRLGGDPHHHCGVRTGGGGMGRRPPGAAVVDRISQQLCSTLSMDLWRYNTPILNPFWNI